MTLEGTPTIVTPAGVAGLTFQDEVETVNCDRPTLRRKTDIESFVILLHEGGFSDGGQNDCGTGLTGPLPTIVPAFHDAVDVVIAGHVNDEFVCEVDGKCVTMADNAGRLFTDIDVTLDKKTKDMTVVSIDNVPNLQSGADDPDVHAIIDKYDALSAPLANTVIGSITADITRIDDAAGESALGDVIADAQLAATTAAGSGEAVVAFMNQGGIRDEIDFASPRGRGRRQRHLRRGLRSAAVRQQPGDDDPHRGPDRDLAGAAVPGRGEQARRLRRLHLQPERPAAPGSKVSAIAIDGVPVDPARRYRVTVNSFLADGGDRFPILIQGTDRLGGDVDLDALVTYFEANSPVAPGPQNRVTPLP